MTLSKDELKSRVYREIDSRADEIVAVAEAVADIPEPGYREVKTSRLVAGKLRGLGLAVREGLALTGVKAVAAGGYGPGPAVAILGELDALIVPGHVRADPTTGAAHACGHDYECRFHNFFL